MTISHAWQTNANNHVPTILTNSFGLLFGPVGTCSILRNVSIPSITRPKTTCFLSRKSHFAVVMKNCRIYLLIRRRACTHTTHLASIRIGTRIGLEIGISESGTRVEMTMGDTMESRPGPVCFSWKFSSCRGKGFIVWYLDVESPYREFVSVDRKWTRSVAVEEVSS